MKSIRTKITICLILTVLIGLVTSGTLSIMLNYNNTMSTVEQMMNQTAVLAAGRVQQELKAYKNVVMEVGCIPQLSDPEVSVEEKKLSLMGVFLCMVSKGEILLVQMASVFLMETIIQTVNMCVKRCRETFLYQSH